MFGARRGRPSLIGRAAQTAARTAVITATATTVAGKVGGRGGAAPQAAATPASAPPPLAAEPQAIPAAGALSDDAIARLKQLADLHTAGILSAEEFAEQKARLLA